MIQLRLKGAPTEEVVALGLALGDLDLELVVNDDVDAALELGCGVHLGQGDAGIERAREAGIMLGISATKRREAAVAEFAGATYVGAGPIWETPSKPDAGPADRARRAARHLPLGLDPGRRDRRHRRVERRRVHPGRSARALPSFAPWPRSKLSGRLSMKLSDAGELGLLRELEARGLIVGTEHDAAEFPGGLVLTQDALVEGVHFLLDRISWHELGFRAAAVNISDLSASAARPEALFVTLALTGETRSSSRWSSSTRAWPRRACPCAAATRPARVRPS